MSNPTFPRPTDRDRGTAASAGTVTRPHGAVRTSRAVACAVAALCLVAGRPITATAGPWVAGNYVGWGASSYPPSAIDFSSLTQINVFSVVPNPNGTLDTTLFIDSVNGPLVAKDIASRAHAAGKKAVLVIGGAGTETQFKSATSPSYMNTFVQNLVSTMNTWGFDGVDIDWEPLPPADYSQMLALLANLRAAKPGLMLTTDVGWLNSNFALSSTDAQFYANLAAAVDQMNIMTYDMADNWGGWAAWHSSAIYGEGANHPSSVSSSVRGYLAAGVPAAKLGIGIGFYGACWNAPVTAPLQSPGPSHVVASDNTMGFATIKNLYYTPAHAFVDAAAQAPYLSFSTATGPAGCTFISYEDEASVALKAQYVLGNGLGGALIWQLNEGYNPGAADPSSLLHAVGTAFLTTSSPVSSSTAVSAKVNPAVVGQPVTLTAIVTGADGRVPSGSVTFKDGATVIGSASLSSGAASISAPFSTAGTHNVTAAYGGSAAYSSSSSSLAEVIAQASTATTLASSRNPSKRGQSVTFTASVKVVLPGGGVPTGSIAFMDGTTQIGTVTLSSGKATLSTTSLASGAHLITASYKGSANYAVSTSARVTQTVR